VSHDATKEGRPQSLLAAVTMPNLAISFDEGSRLKP
jgi:hypothetical protein